MKVYLAIDIGASSGRHMIGYRNQKNELIIEELYRFSNGIEKENGHLIWNIQHLLEEVKKGIALCLKAYPKIESMSIDTWGVDYVLLNEEKEILPVYAYRDTRTKEVIDEVHQKISFEKLYSITGCQFQEFNTIYQLYWDKKKRRLDQATDFLMIPEYLFFQLTGKKIKEYTNASTTGLLDIYKCRYAEEIFETIGLNTSLIRPLEQPGYRVGDFTVEIQKELGGNIPVVLCATHDTASAVEGIPMEENAPYISSGTWSLLGIKSLMPISTPAARLANYSNETGPNYIRLQKNIMGLWIIQGLSKALHLDFPEMVELAKTSKYDEIFDVNDSCFLSSLNMKEEIKNWFMKRNLPLPTEDKDFINTAYRSLAASYKTAIEELEHITNQTYTQIYIVGGGAKNPYLNQLTEQMTKKKVLAYPIEASARGNILVQMKENVK